MVSPEAELATEFFSIANIVTGFYVAQTLLFLNILGKEAELRTSLIRKRDIGRRVTWFIASLYVICVLACSTAEVALRWSKNEAQLVLVIATGAGIGRLGIILCLAGLCQYILRQLQPPAVPSE